MSIISISILGGLLLLLIFLTAIIARLIKAKRHGLVWSFVIWALAVGPIVPMLMLPMDPALVFVVAFLILLLGLLVVMQTGVMGAFSIVVANAAITISLIGGLFLADKGIAIDSSRDIVGYFPSSEYASLPFTFLKEPVEEIEEEEEVVYFSENDLLPEAMVRSKEIVLNTREYAPLKLGDVNRVRGETLRVLKNDGTTVKGTLVEYKNNHLILRTYSDDIQQIYNLPVPVAVIKKLEVYR